MDNHELKENVEIVRQLLGERTITLVGLMGAGKSAIGRKVAAILHLPFIDADNEIEDAAKMTVAEIFDAYGEPEFRRVEISVIKRILESGPQILATGGGAFMNEQTRNNIAQNSISVWLDADIDLLMQRVSKKTTRPLLKKPNPRGIMLSLLEQRNPTYALANIKVTSQDVTKDKMAAVLIANLAAYLKQESAKQK